MSGPAVGRLMAALQGIHQCSSIWGIHRCCLTANHEGRHVWSNGNETITWLLSTHPTNVVQDP